MGIQGIVAIYIVCINLITFVVMGVDKQKAKKQKYRISEKTLFTLAIIGGSIGGWLGMYYFRHKTKHVKFVIGFPTICIIHTFFVLYCLITK